MSAPVRCGVLLATASAWCWTGEHPEWARLLAVGDLERRSKQALQFADQRFDEAVGAYERGELERGAAELEWIGDAVELAVESLQATGKHPRRHPRHFKQAEIRTRRLLQRLRDVRAKAHLEDKPAFDQAMRRVDRANSALLEGLMSRRD